MKKTTLLLSAGIVCGVTLLFPACHKKPAASAQVGLAALAPADTALFVAVPDARRTRERWKASALAQIIAEPEVQAFLKRPMDEATAKIGQQGDFLAKIDKAQPARAFLALSGSGGRPPAVIAGFAISGPRQDADALVADLKKRVQQARPAGKADLVKHGEVTIETYTFNGKTVAIATKGEWYLGGNDVDLLKSTLDRLDGRGAAPSLDGEQLFKTAMTHVPADADAEVFVRTGDFVKRLTDLMALTGRPVQERQFDELKKIQSVAASLKFDGPNMRDTIFIMRSGGVKSDPIERQSLALTTKDTLLYYVMRWTVKGSDLEETSASNPATSAVFGALDAALKSRGMALADAADVFGPEISSILDWPAASTAPSLVLALGVKDKAKAGQVVQTLTDGSLGNVPWDRRENAGGTYFIKTDGALLTMTPVLALDDKMLLFGLSVDAVKSAIERMGASGGKLSESPAFQKAEASVAKAQNSFGYVDGAALFERIYAFARPFLMMAPVMAPQFAKHVPVDKLPGTETISKHLGPIVYSQAETPEGVLIESAGPVTMNQAILGTAAVVGVVAVPLAKSGMAGMVAPGLVPQVRKVPPATPPPAAEESPAPESPVTPTPSGGTVPEGASGNQ